MCKHCCLSFFAGLYLLVALPLQAQDLAAKWSVLDELRSTNDVDLDLLEQRGKALLKTYQRPMEHAQIRYQLAHVHAQSGLKQPGKVIEHATAALDSKLVTPSQRATLYSYLSSAHELDREEVPDFSERRRKALSPLLEGLKELEMRRLPKVAPELPIVGVGERDSVDPAERARVEAESKAALARRTIAERTRELVHLRDTLKDQVKWLYYREPVADDELQELASKKLGSDLAFELTSSAFQERERLAKARAERGK